MWVKKRVFPCISLSFVISFKIKLSLATPPTLRASPVCSKAFFSHSMLDRDEYIEAETLLCRNFVANILPIDLHHDFLDRMAGDSKIMQSTDVVLEWLA